MKTSVALIFAGLICTGCNSVSWNSDILNGSAGGGVFNRPSDPSPQGTPTDVPLDATGTAVPGTGVQSQTAAVPQQGAVGTRGTTVAGLGDPGIPGLWLETALVSQAGAGRVRTSNGSSLVLTLKPLPGEGGSRLSIDAMRALGVPLTELVELTVQPLG